MIQQRIEELRAELAKGEQHLAALERERSATRDTILRIQGALQVLEELLAAEEQPREARPVLARTPS
jgi:septal ring factor EnvC (AmiA/AmiB activator)